jgi:cupin 2 domain-containing protein
VTRPDRGNLLRELPRPGPAESLEVLARSPGVRVERIVSRGHRSPDGSWYEQDEDEWVLLVEGAAVLVYEDGARVSLAPFDWVEIPAGVRHRVEWTDPDADTVWLAVFRKGGGA